MSPTRGVCHFCGESVETIQAAAFPVTGWEAERSGGGANQIMARNRVQDGRIAHVPCVKAATTAARHGIAVGQQALV